MRRRQFGIFWLAQGLSAAGDAFSLIAIPLLVLRETGSITQMGLLTGLTSVGSIASGTYAGSVVDRVDRRRLMLLCDGARAVLFGLIPVLWLAEPQVWTLYLIVPLAAVFSMTFHVAYVTAVPGLVPKEDLTAANGKLEATYAAMTLVGMTLAGVVAAAFGPVTAIAIDAASFVLSMACLFVIRFASVTATGPEAAGSVRSRAGFLAGVRFLWETPILKTLTILLSLQTFLTLGLVDVFIFHLKHDLVENDRAVGYVLAVATIGSMVAGGLVPYVRRAFGLGWCWVGSYVACGVAICCIGLSHNVVSVSAVAVAFMFCTGVAGTCSLSLRQEITPDHLLGRVTSAFWTIHNALGPIGAALLTAAVARYSVSSVSLLAGVLAILIALAGIFTPLRSSRDGATSSVGPQANGG